MEPLDGSLSESIPMSSLCTNSTYNQSPCFSVHNASMYSKLFYAYTGWLKDIFSRDDKYPCMSGGKAGRITANRRQKRNSISTWHVHKGYEQKIEI